MAVAALRSIAVRHIAPNSVDATEMQDIARETIAAVEALAATPLPKYRRVLANEENVDRELREMSGDGYRVHTFSHRNVPIGDGGSWYDILFELESVRRERP